MWKVRRAAACASTLRRWCALPQESARVCTGLEVPGRRFCTSEHRPFDGSRKILGTTRILSEGGSGYSFSTSRGFATRTKRAAQDESEAEESDEFESEADDLKAFSASESSEESSDEEADEEPEQSTGAIVPVQTEEKRLGPYERRQNMIRIDKLEQELWRRCCLLRKGDSIVSLLEQWKKEGNEVTPTMVVSVIDKLKTAGRFTHALQVIEHAVKDESIGVFKQAKPLLIDITARSKGIAAGEKIFEELPESEKTKAVYSSLLARYVYVQNVKKSEELFAEMEKLGYVSDSPFAHNLMMKLYKQKGDTAKFQEVLTKAHDVAVQPNIFTYNVMLELKAKNNDFEGLEKIYEEIKANATLRPESQTHSIMARAYLRAGMLAHAEVHLLRLEIGQFRKTKSTFEFLMASYGELGLAEDVERMWQKCKAIPGNGFNSFLVLQRAMAMAGEVERVESMFKHMESWRRSPAFDAKRHNNLLLVYYKSGMKDKANEQETKMEAGNIKVTLTNAEKTSKNAKPAATKKDNAEKSEKETQLKKDKAEKSGKETQLKKALEEAAEKGDVKGAELAFENCRKANMNRASMWNRLLKAYVKAEAPAYGFLERMKAEKVEPNEDTQALLKEINTSVNL